ncbi:MAG: glycosyltransferase family protein [Planctomycetota bacterium]|jgi:hypothetical protein
MDENGNRDAPKEREFEPPSDSFPVGAPYLAPPARRLLKVPAQSPVEAKTVRTALAALLLANLIFIAVWNVSVLFSHYSTGQDLAKLDHADRNAVEKLGADAKYSFPSDDAWIHHQFARNLATRFSLEFNPGISSTGTTAPMWTAVLAFGQLVFGDSPAVCYWFTNLINFIFMYGVLLLIVVLARKIFESEAVGWMAAFLTVNECHMSWALLSGMEIPLFMLLMLAAFTFFAYDRFLLAGLAAGLCFNTRPVGLIVIAILAADLGFKWLFSDDRRAALKPLLKLCGTWLLAALPVIITFLVISGDVLPNTFDAKTNFYRGYHKTEGFLRSVFFHFSNDFFTYLAPFAVAFIVEMFVLSIARRKRHPAFPLLVFCILFISAFAVTLPAAFQRARYFQPMFPVVILFMTAGTVCLLAERSIVVAAVTVPLIILAFIYFPIPDKKPPDKLFGFPFRDLKALSLIGVALVAWLGTIDAVVRRFRPRRTPLTAVSASAALIVGPVLWVPRRIKDFFITYHAAAVRGLVVLVILGISLVDFISFGLDHAELYLMDCRYITNQHIVTGRWLSENTEPGEVVATHDIGALAYFSRRPVLDLIGLVEPDMIPYARVDSKAVIVIANEPNDAIISAIIGAGENIPHVFRSPADAAAKAEEIAAAAPERNIALVIYDAPDEVEAVKAGVAALRSSPAMKNVPVQVIVGAGMLRERPKLYSAGINGIMKRPLNVTEIKRVITPHLSRKRHWSGRRLLLGEDEKSSEIIGRYSGAGKSSIDYFVGFYQPGAGFFEDIIVTPRGEPERFKRVFSTPRFIRSCFGVYEVVTVPAPPDGAPKGPKKP